MIRKSTNKHRLTMHNQSNRIQQASRKLCKVLWVLFFIIPVSTALVWIFFNQMPDPMHKMILPYFATLPLPLPSVSRLLGFLVMMIPGGIVMYGMYKLICLFKLYEQGWIFQLANVRCFRNLSRTLIVWFIAQIISKPMMSVALTLHLPPGKRQVILGFGTPDLAILLVGCILAVITWVMEEGHQLQKEQDLTV